MILNLFQLILNGIAALIDVVAAALPGSPITKQAITISETYLGYINYFLPIGQIVDLCTVWLACIGGYYIYMALGRWCKILD